MLPWEEVAALLKWTKGIVIALYVAMEWVITLSWCSFIHLASMYESEPLYVIGIVLGSGAIVINTINKHPWPYVIYFYGGGIEGHILKYLSYICVCLLVAQLCLTLWSRGGSLPGSSVLEILQTRTLEWVALATTQVFWPGEFCGLDSRWGCKESDMTEWLSLSHIYIYICIHTHIYNDIMTDSDN